MNSKRERLGKISTIHETEKLRDLILQHPELPIMISVGEEANNGDYSYTVCTDVCVENGEYLDCEGPDDLMIYTDRTNLEDDVGEAVYIDMPDAEDEKLEAEVKRRMEEYEPYWKGCIIIWANN